MKSKNRETIRAKKCPCTECNHIFSKSQTTFLTNNDKYLFCDKNCTYILDQIQI